MNYITYQSLIDYEFALTFVGLTEAFKNRISIENVMNYSISFDSSENINDLICLSLWNTLESGLTDKAGLLSNKRELLDKKDDYHNEPALHNTKSTQCEEHRKVPNFKFETIKQIKGEKVITKGKGENSIKLKLRGDCIRKRIKSLLLSYVIKQLNSLLGASTKEGGYLLNLPKEFNIDIKRESNKQLLNSAIREVFSIFPAIPKYAKRCEHNLKVITSSDNPLFLEIVSKKMKELYISYLNSTSYIKDLEMLESKEGEHYVATFKGHADSFLSYFGVN